ncbi:hypothetical protein CR513_27698, partial [Mucuna pruriens]
MTNLSVNVDSQILLDEWMQLRDILHRKFVGIFIDADSDDFVIWITRLMVSIMPNQRQEEQRLWSPPEEECIKVNGNSWGNPGMFGVGGLMRNYTARFFGFCGLSTNSIAKLLAIFTGLELAFNEGFRNVIAGKLSHFLIISNYNSPHHPQAPLLDNIHELLDKSLSVSVRHILRDGLRAFYE